MIELDGQKRPHRASEDQFLGGLLGLGIGDALGMPVAGWSDERIRERFGRLKGYESLTRSDGTVIEAGEFTDESEVGLCIAETLTSNRGELDSDLLGSRLLHLARTDSALWMGQATREALEHAEETLDFAVPLNDDGPATGDVAARGIVVGLIASLGPFDADRLRADAEAVTRITHGGPAQIAATAAVAYAVNLAARRASPPRQWAGQTAEFLESGELHDALLQAVAVVESTTTLKDTLAAIGTGIDARESVSASLLVPTFAEEFTDTVIMAVNAGGATDTIGGIAGALAGAYYGARGIPQWLIDGLGGRIYISLAGPWLYRTAMQRSGLMIDIRTDSMQPPPRPTEPPRV